MSLEKIVVIALGGNQIAHIKKGKPMPSIEEQITVTENTSEKLVEFFEENPDYIYVIGHGNGPQSGNLILSTEEGKKKYLNQCYKFTIDTAVAATQGEIGFMLQNKIGKNIVTLVTQVLVDPDDPEFQNPTKPIGGLYSAEEIMSRFKRSVIRKNNTQSGKPDLLVETNEHRGTYRYFPSKKGYRIVVPSPKPIDILEFAYIKILIENSVIPITVGGGGIPVIKTDKGYQGIEAVIDKDFASALLAKKLKEEYKDKEVELIILTGGPAVCKNFNDLKNIEIISKMDIESAQALYDQGQFPPGNMGPKVMAAIDALNNGVSRVLITDPEHLISAFKGEDGTRIYKTGGISIYPKGKYVDLLKKL